MVLAGNKANGYLLVNHHTKTIYHHHLANIRTIYKSLSVLVHFLLFTIYLIYLSFRMLLSAVLKYANFVILLFFTNLTSKIFIVLLFLTQTQYYLIMVFGK